MIAVTLMWSIAGIVTRHLDSARGFELTFWRSLFNALALLLLLGWMQGPSRLWRTLRGGGRPLWVSGLCWCVMYTAFMLAITLTTVANVLVTMAIAPLLTAIAARVALGHRLAAAHLGGHRRRRRRHRLDVRQRTQRSDPRHWIGTAVALCVPIAAAVNWTLLQHVHRGAGEQAPDMLAPVLLGALLSAAADAAAVAATGGVSTRPGAARPAGRGAAGHSLPDCGARGPGAERARGRRCSACWKWCSACSGSGSAADESPSVAVLGGGALVLGALAANEALALRRVARRDLILGRALQPGWPSRYHAAQFMEWSSGMADPSTEPRPPSPWLMLMEGRAPWEYAATAGRDALAAPPAARRRPPGDRVPRPGRVRLTHRAAAQLPAAAGYTAYAWNQGFNFGPRDGVLDACRQQVQQVAERHGRKVSLIGWSLGGVYARELAKELRRADALRHHARHAVHRPPARHQRLALLRARTAASRVARPGADAERLRRRRRCRPPRSTARPTASSPGNAASTTTRRRPRTSRSTPATSAWA